MRLIVRGEVYPSVKAAAEAFGCTTTTIYRHLTRHGHLDWLGRRPPQPRPDLRKPYEIGALRFESVSAAAQALGLSRKTLRNARCRAASQQTVLRAAMLLHVDNPQLVRQPHKP